MAQVSPHRVDVSAARREPPRWVAWMVAGALAVTAAGGFAVTAALEDPSGTPLDIGGAVRVSPLSGWTAVGRAAVDEWTFGRLIRGTGTLDVAVRELPVTAPGEVARAYLDRFLRRELTRLSVDERLQQVTLASGTVGVRFRYTGFLRDSATTIEGEVTAVVTASGAGVAFDASSPDGLLSFVIGDARTMIGDAVIA